jgi:RNA recognition motif-containing protein
LMRTFGHLVGNVDMVKNSKTPTSEKVLAFVEYKTFSEAERAMRELNSLSNTGLNVHAEFAYDRRQAQKKNVLQDPERESSSSNNNNPELIEDIEVHVPITVKFREHIVDENFEKVTYFEYKKLPLTRAQLQAKAEMKKLAMASKGKYDEQKVLYS